MEKPICYSIYSTSTRKVTRTGYEGEEYDEEEGYEEKGHQEEGQEEKEEEELVHGSKQIVEDDKEKTKLAGKWVVIGMNNYVHNPRN